MTDDATRASSAMNEEDLDRLSTILAKPLGELTILDLAFLAAVAGEHEEQILGLHPELAALLDA
jgi:hypothetical protein